jgi:hypothetical protein
MEEIFTCICGFEFKLGLEVDNKNIKCPDCSAMLGFWDKEKLPFKKGDEVQIRKGVPVYSMKSGDRKLAGRNYWITVDHILSGAHYFEKGRMVIKNPEVRWSGSGGYWNSVDINSIKDYKKRKNEKK